MPSLSIHFTHAFFSFPYSSLKEQKARHGFVRGMKDCGKRHQSSVSFSTLHLFYLSCASFSFLFQLFTFSSTLIPFPNLLSSPINQFTVFHLLTFYSYCLLISYRFISLFHLIVSERERNKGLDGHSDLRRRPRAQNKIMWWFPSVQVGSSNC